MQRLTSEAERDRQQQLIDRLREQLRALRAKLRLLEKEQQIKLNEAQRGLDSAKAGLKKAELAIDVEAARQAVALAEAELERVTLLAPVDAVVLEVDAQAGQTIGQRPILTLGETASMFAVAEIYQSDVQRVALGQKAVIRTPAIPGELTGVVESVGSVVQRNQVFGLDPTARTDARVVEARIRLDQPDKAARFIGLQVDVTIDIPPASAP
jgi:HlyD family secretion protein